MMLSLYAESRDSSPVTRQHIGELTPAVAARSNENVEQVGFVVSTLSAIQA